MQLTMTLQWAIRVTIPETLPTSATTTQGHCCRHDVSRYYLALFYVYQGNSLFISSLTGLRLRVTLWWQKLFGPRMLAEAFLAVR